LLVTDAQFQRLFDRQLVFFPAWSFTVALDPSPM
jgi:hypothetical protein